MHSDGDEIHVKNRSIDSLDMNMKNYRVALVALLVAQYATFASGNEADRRAMDAYSLKRYQQLATTKNPKDIVAGQYRMDIHHTSVTVRLAHDDLSYYTLRFNDIAGTLTFDPAHSAATELNVTIDPKSVDTGDKEFDQKIATRYFEADQHPAITFTSASVTLSSGHFVIDGTMEFHGVKRPLKLDATFNGFTSHYGDGPRMGFSATGTFNRSDFGVGQYVPLEADKVSISIETELEKV